MKKNANKYPIPQSLITSNNRSCNKQNRKEGKPSPQRDEESTCLPNATGWKAEICKAALTTVHPYGMGQRPTQWIAFAQHHKCCCLTLDAKMAHTNEAGDLYTVSSRALDLRLNPLGPGGVSLWHTLWQRCFSLGCFSFLVANQRYFIQYQLSWGMYFKRLHVSPA